MKYAIVIERVVDDKLDGWSYKRHDGSRVHDCALGSLINYAKALGDIRPEEEFFVINERGDMLRRVGW